MAGPDSNARDVPDVPDPADVPDTAEAPDPADAPDPAGARRVPARSDVPIPTEVRIPAQVRTRRLGREVILLDLDTERHFGLDGIGAALWLLLREGRSVPDAVHHLGERYDVDHDVLVTDVAALVDVLVRRGLLARHPAETETS